MIVAVEHASGEVLKISTRTHVHECGRAKAKRLTLKTLRTVVIPSTGLNLLQTLSKSPSGKEIQKTHWERYLSFILPLVDVRAEAYRRRAVRRVRFENFMKRDKSLDTLCNRLCSLGRGTREQTTLIAFGDGSHCSTPPPPGGSTGFGHAPAPMRRFRKRLEQIHGARVTLIREAYTSQKCSQCLSQLEPWRTTSFSKRGRDTSLAVRPDGICCPATRRVSTKEIHGVRLCLSCRGKDDHPRFWHRDVNAARNMVAIYLSLATNRTRPECFNHNE